MLKNLESPKPLFIKAKNDNQALCNINLIPWKVKSRKVKAVRFKEAKPEEYKHLDQNTSLLVLKKVKVQGTFQEHLDNAANLARVVCVKEQKEYNLPTSLKLRVVLNKLDIKPAKAEHILLDKAVYLDFTDRAQELKALKAYTHQDSNNLK